MDRTQAPISVAIDRPQLPALNKIDLNEQLEVYVLNQGKQEVVLLELIVPIGRYQEPAPGLAYYVFKMLTEGTKRWSSEEIVSQFDFYGSHLEITPTLDHVSIKLYSLSRFFDKVLQLVCELLTDPTFPSHEFEILKQIRIQQIKQQDAKNNVFASLKFRELLFGPDHPYGRKISSEQAQLTTLHDLEQFKSALLTKPVIFLTGKITDKELNTLSNCLGGISFAQRTPANSHETNPQGSLSLKKEGSTQASIRLGRTIISRNHPDIHLLKVTNEILGGFFGSRLMKNIREEKGLTYGIHSSLLHLEHASYWSINSEVMQDKADLALEEILREIEKLRQQPPSDQELNMVTNYMKGKFLSAFDSPFNSHNMMKTLVLDGLEWSAFIEYFETLQNITSADISTMATKYFREETLTSLIVS